MGISFWEFACKQSGNTTPKSKASRILCFAIGGGGRPHFNGARMAASERRWLVQQIEVDSTFLDSLDRTEDRVESITKRLFADEEQLSDFLSSNNFDMTWSQVYNPKSIVRKQWFEGAVISSEEDVNSDQEPGGPETRSGSPGEVQQAQPNSKTRSTTTSGTTARPFLSDGQYIAVRLKRALRTHGSDAIAGVVREVNSIGFRMTLFAFLYNSGPLNSMLDVIVPWDNVDWIYSDNGSNDLELFISEIADELSKESRKSLRRSGINPE